MTAWIIAIAIAFILLKAAYRSQEQVGKSVTPDGAKTGILLMSFFAVAALGFVLVAVVLAKP